MSANDESGHSYCAQLLPVQKGIRRFCFGSKLRARDYQSPFRLWAVSQKSSFQSVTLAFMLPMRFKNAAK